MRIWIDITNSPHVLFFRPIISRLQADGHDVHVTARRFAQTVPLLRRYGIPHRLIGAHGGRSRVRKALRFLHRLTRLLFYAAGRRFDLAMGHASNDVCVVARLLCIPQVTAFDYEYARLSHSVNLKLVDRCLVPKWLPDDVLTGYGIAARNVMRYDGLKEEVYLWDFLPDSAVIRELALDSARPVVTFRPPATMAAYHPKTAQLTWDTAELLAARPDLQIVCLPRTEEQREEFARRSFANFTIPRAAVDGPSLIAASDLVICGGGTMNREAAALSTPVWAIFEGVIGAVDRHLAQTGRLRVIRSVDDVRDFTIERKPKSDIRIDRTTFDEVYRKLLRVRRSVKWPHK